MDSDLNQAYGSTYAARSNEFTRANYHFTGWNTMANGGGTAYAEGATFPIAGNVTLYAQWSIDTYTVAYDNNDGDGTMDSDLNQAYGSTYAARSNEFTRANYQFTGWNTAANGGGTAYAEGDEFTITGNVTLYAIWTPIPFTITYVMNGGVNAATNPATYTVESALITLAAPTRLGYTFTGWTPTNNIPAGSTGERTFTATWSAPIVYPITYVMNGGVNAGVNPATYTVVSATINLAAPTRAGYFFLGWTPAGIIPAGSTGARVFTATWSAPVVYPITYVMNGGVNSGFNPATYTVVSATINLAAPTREGFDFLGWTPTNSIPAGSVGARTFTADWSNPRVHTVTYIVSGGTLAGLDGTTPYAVYADVPYGSAVPIPNNPSQDDYSFDGWSSEIPSTMPDEDIVIYGSMTSLPVLQEIITPERTPLAGPTWALLNLILTIVTALAIVSIFTLLKKRDVELSKRSKAFRWLTLVPAIGAIVAFLLTEDMSNPMVFTDQWTILMVGIAVVQVLVIGFGFQKKKQDA
jgi:uncharacterized repeat protein (TIGR02543 family)